MKSFIERLLNALFFVSSFLKRQETRAKKMKQVQEPVQTSMALVYETGGVRLVTLLAVCEDIRIMRMLTMTLLLALLIHRLNIEITMNIRKGT